MGYKVTPQDTAACRRIRPAMGETDTGVVICYNTVKDVRYANPIISATCMGINPVNWRTDDTPATLHDTITVRLSPEHHVLVVSGYSGSEYKPYRGFINVGDIHSCEPWLYSECIARNMAVRARQWRKVTASEAYFASAMTSISINAPLGSVLTATAERAGYGSVKNSA